MKLVDPNKMKKKDLVAFALNVQNLFFLDDSGTTVFINPSKEVDPDTIAGMLDLLKDFGLSETTGGVTCRFCQKKIDERIAHKLDDDHCCDDCWDERLRS